ncbi:MAG: hypothetical protein ACOX1F_00750 [Erysipelotrichaceae bacterium]|jgi:hypothetical protein
MSINRVLSFLKKQGVLDLTNNKKLDTELATSYLSVLFESDRYSDQHISNKDYFAQSVKNAFLYFDGNGFASKIYTSLCYFFDELLSKDDYYIFADKLIHKISGTRNLSKYINMNTFIRNCKADFDPSSVEFKKTDGMILKDEKSFLSGFKRDYHYKRIVLCYDQLPGLFIFDTSTTYLDLDKDVYVYFIDVKGEAYQFDSEGIQVNKRKKTVTVSLPVRSNVIVSNYPVIKRVAQKLEDKTAEMKKTAADDVKNEIKEDTASVKTTGKTVKQPKPQQNRQEVQKKVIPTPEKGTAIKRLTSKQIRANPKLLARERQGLKKAITSSYSNKFFYLPAISAGKYKLSNVHLNSLDITYGFLMVGFSLITFEVLKNAVKILGKLPDGTIIYEVVEDCHVVVFAGRKP